MPETPSRRRSARAARGALLSLFALLPRLGAQAQQVTTVAGSGQAGQQNGPAREASFQLLTGVAVDARGDLYVTELPATIRRVAREGTVSTHFPGTTPVYFHQPTGIALEANGNLLVSDLGEPVNDGDVLRIRPDGTFAFLESMPAKFYGPAGLAVDASGNAWVADLYAGVGFISPQGAGSVVVPGLVGVAIALDADGAVYVSEKGRHRIRKVAPGGAVSTLAGSGSPGFADGPGEAASFRDPQGLAVDAFGNLYVADTGNHRIRRVAPDGVVTTLAGTGEAGFADGEALSARFNAPAGLALDRAGQLYVADTGNHRVRKVSLSRWIVPTAARVPGARGALWTTELAVHNRGPEPAAATIRFLGNGDDTRGQPEATLSIPAHGSVSIPDVLSSLFGIAEGFGAIEVLGGSGLLAVRSRTSSPSGDGSVGTGVPAVPEAALFTDRTSPPPVLAGLREDDAVRSNVVLVNGGAAPLTVVLTARDASGRLVGERLFTVPPRGMVQESGFLRGPGYDLEGGGVVSVSASSPTPGASYTVLAFTIDNGSNDPTTVLPQ